MSDPVISIGLPVYNGARYLDDTMQSLVEQDFGDFEILACDNASTDETLSILEQWRARDPRIRILTSPTNRGAAWNYNRSVSVARGRYYKWAACDDLLSPDYFSACIELFESVGPELVLVYPPTTLIGPQGNHLEDYEDGIQLEQARPHLRLLSLLQNLRLCNAVFGLHRIEALRASAMIGSYVSSDVVLLAELSLHGRIERCERGCFYRRMHDDSAYGGQRSLRDIALWFDTTPEPGLFLPRSRLLLEFMRSIQRAPILERDRLRACSTLLRFWLPRNWRAMAGEWKRELLSARRRAS